MNFRALAIKPRPHAKRKTLPGNLSLNVQMKTYELTYIVSPEITAEEAVAKGKEIESLIQAKEGLIVKQSNPSAKTLSYPVKKRASGFLGILEFKSEPEKLLELKETIGKDNKIIRYILVIKRPIKPKKIRGARKIIQAKEGTDVLEDNYVAEK